eukprot:3923104-Lingulodinium_polyedra.AAC.1
MVEQGLGENLKYDFTLITGDSGVPAAEPTSGGSSASSDVAAVQPLADAASEAAEEQGGEQPAGEAAA